MAGVNRVGVEVEMRGEDEREYVEYVTARLPVLRRAAYLMCGDVHRADDIVQATITTLYRKWRRARTAGNLDAYVQRILFRKHLDERRLGWARVRLLADPPESTAPAAADVAEREALRTALERLPRTQRTVLVLRYACDLSVEDVARVLGCSASNVKSHTARGLAALRDLYEVPEMSPSDETRGSER
jgi:RNA polymerase sigma-70 factor (sigma-E family)